VVLFDGFYMTWLCLVYLQDVIPSTCLLIEEMAANDVKQFFSFSTFLYMRMRIYVNCFSIICIWFAFYSLAHF